MGRDGLDRPWAAALVLSALMLACSSSVRAETPSERCAEVRGKGESGLPLPYQPKASDDLVHLRVAGTRYAIPENYFRYPVLGCDTEENGFLLRVLLPTFEGWTKENDEAIQGSRDTPNMGMNILLEIVPGDMKLTFLAFARGADSAGDHPTWDGLLKTKNASGDDVFFAREHGAVTFLMVCNTVEQLPYPGCTQHFRYRGAKVEATFRRRMLHEWRTIQERTIRLLDGFVEAVNKRGE